MPAAIAQREVPKGRLDEACANLQAEAGYEERMAAWEGRNRRGGKPKPPDDAPPPDRQRYLTDPDSKLMRKSKRHEVRQAYNVQAVVDADSSQLVPTTNVAQTPSDGPTFEETTIQLCECLSQPETILSNAVANLQVRRHRCAGSRLAPG